MATVDFDVEAASTAGRADRVGAGAPERRARAASQSRISGAA
ncbi:hypothetical protein C7S16_0541 [Burkholderia thailandensis]|uniref:Uncharacterized protein n=1 Tax=Burkholderia thailandensis TaxID=57975 RepID=A0AAW9CY42_BURTH|nr:hypothetical protein [Burkholderia thailandensis]MDW9255524.1 hypothetical protein [Burkholderia thailandensis]